MKKNPIPKINETSENMKGMKLSMLMKAGIVKNMIDTIINMIPTAKSNFNFSIF
jgi:hypothetical protein